MKSSIVTIIGGALEILGCCALAFAGLLAWAKWGGVPEGGLLLISFLKLTGLCGLP
jgi:hypothetical protein